MINAGQMRAVSEAANAPLRSLIQEICNEVEKTATEGRFKCEVATDIYQDDVLDYVAHYFNDFGFEVNWNQPRGDGLCHRVVIVRWY